MRTLFIILIFVFAIVTIATHAVELEIPENDGVQVYEYLGFTLLYNEEHEQAEWVAYYLEPAELNGPWKRKNNFRVDPSIITSSAHPDDYRRTGYDRGHLAPAGDMSWAEQAMNESFFMSNMSPQDPQFNRIAWRNLEALVRNWAEKYNGLYIVTGPILTDGPYESIGENKVSIPKYYYKVLLAYDGDEAKMIAFLMPNEKCEAPLFSYVVTVDTIEYITGIDFFYLLEDIEEENLERQAQYFIW